jgi:hypothetical protein
LFNPLSPERSAAFAARAALLYLLLRTEWMRLAVFPAPTSVCMWSLLSPPRAEIHRSLAALRAHNPSCEKRHPVRYMCARFRVSGARERKSTPHTNSRNERAASVLTRGARRRDYLFATAAHVICMEQIARPLSPLASLKGEMRCVSAV